MAMDQKSNLASLSFDSTDAADVSCDGSLPQRVVVEHLTMGATCGVCRTLARRCDDGHDLRDVSQSHSLPVFIEFIKSKGDKGSKHWLRDEPVFIPSETNGLELVGVTSSTEIPTTFFGMRQEHADGSVADEWFSPTDTNDEHECRPVQGLHSATGSQQERALTEQLSVVQQGFQNAVLRKVPLPELYGKTKRNREREWSEYRTNLKVCHLQFMGFGEAEVRQALKETHVWNIRTEQHLQDAAHRLNTDQLVNLVWRALQEPSQRDTMSAEHMAHSAVSVSYTHLTLPTTPYV